MSSLFINWLVMIIMAYCRLAMRDAGLKASDFQSKSILFAMIGSLIKTNITNLDNFQDKSCLCMIWDPTVREKLGIGDRCMKSNKQELEGVELRQTPPSRLSKIHWRKARTPKRLYETIQVCASGFSSELWSVMISLICLSNTIFTYQILCQNGHLGKQNICG